MVMYRANPILFDGTVIPRHIVQSGVQYLDEQIDRLSKKYSYHVDDDDDDDYNDDDDDGAKWRQCRAARQYILDAFGSSNVLLSRGWGYYVTARINSPQTTNDGGGSSARRSATLWPVSLQGPLLVATPPPPVLDDNNNNVEEEESWMMNHLHPVLVIEPLFFSGSNHLVEGMVIGHGNNQIDYAIVSPGTILPRFAFESDEDGMALNNIVCNAGQVVERIAFESEEGEEEEGYDGGAFRRKSETDGAQPASTFVGRVKWCRYVSKQWKVSCQ